jgi:hypothetical protein
MKNEPLARQKRLKEKKTLKTTPTPSPCRPTLEDEKTKKTNP